MNPVQRFFRRYIFSTVRIVLLFLVINIALFFLLMLSGSMSSSDKSFHIQDLSDHVTLQNGVWTADDTALSLLEESGAWAMLLDRDGTVIWQQNLPETLPRSYTSADIASFSRWYLDDYPVKVWAREDGSLIVAGFPPRTLIKYYYVLNWPYIGILLGGKRCGLPVQSVPDLIFNAEEYPQSGKSHDSGAAGNSGSETWQAFASGRTGRTG